MKKIALITTLLFLGSCSLFGGKPTTFEEHYVRFMNASVDKTEKTLESMGLYRPSEVSGVIDAMVSIPTLMSGSFQTQLNTKTTGRDAELVFKNGVIQYDGLAGSGRMSYDTLNLVSKAGNLYLSYQGLSDELMATLGASDILKKYEKTWLSFTQADAMSGATADEIRANKMLQRFSEMSLDDVKKYLTEYPIFRATGDLGMSGSLHMWSVELDREKIVALVEQISADLSDEKLSDSDRARLQSELTNFAMVGKVGFSPDDALVGYLDLTASQSGTVLGALMLNMESKNTTFSFQEGQTGAILRGAFAQTDTQDTGKIALVQSGSELGTLTYTLDHTGGRFRDISVELSAQGISVVLKHTQKDDGAFDGRLLLPVGSLSWNGTSQDKKLTALKVQGASPAGALDLDLTASGEMLRGPLVLRADNQEVLRANIGLLAEYNDDHGKFRLALDMPQGTGATDMMHFEFGSDMQRSEWKGSIKVPSSTTPLQKLIDEMQALVPPSITTDTLSGSLPSSEKDTIEPLP